MKKFTYIALLALSLTACNEEKEPKQITEAKIIEAPPVIEEYGLAISDFEVVRDTIRNGDYFGAIMGAHGLSGNKIHEVVTQVKETFNPARLLPGNPYVILKAKDTALTPSYFIYENDRIGYTVVNLGDSIAAYKAKNRLPLKEKLFQV